MKRFALMLVTALVPAFAALAPADEPAATPQPAIVVPPDSTWKWLHPTDGKDPAAEQADFNEKFATLPYDDSKWTSGKDSDGPEGGFGYGDPAGVKWDVPEEANRKTAYLRHTFTTSIPLKNLVLSLQRDDGVIVYLDGKEVGRDNVGDGKEAYDLMAEKTISGKGEKTPIEIQLTGTLEPGEHVLAISLHNRAGGTDLRAAGITLKGVPAPKEAK